MSPDAQALLASTAAEALLPALRVDEASRIVTPLRLVAQASIHDGIEYLLVEDARGVRYGVPAVAEPDRWRRAIPGDGAAEWLVRLVSTEAPGTLEVTRFHGEPAAGERGVGVDQTNELVVVGDVAVVKWMLHPVGGDQPGPNRLMTLERARFGGTPRTWGLVHLIVGDERVLIATVTQFLADAEDGWDWAVRDVRELARGLRGEDDCLEPVRAVAALVGRLHSALAEAGVDVATEDDAERWLAEALADLASADLEPQVADEVRRRLARLGRSAGTKTIDVHGDLHIGQILASGHPRRYDVIDFDGNPTQDHRERMRRQPAARDVAGMLASWDHVGRVVLRRTEGLDDDAVAQVRRWIARAQDAFLADYRRTLADAGWAALLDESLLVPMQVQQECREYAYAARYLPHWRYVPDAALPALLSRTIAETETT